MAVLEHTLYVVSATHWDREWRFPFQETRMMLVNMIDHLLDLLEREPAYACYHLDGPTIPLEDYLEIRPEAEERLRRQVAAGRLFIGPWYTLPDANTVSPESLVRNLLWGDRLARRFGQPMPVGYMPCSYGQVSQMPQVLAGFGLTSVMFYRGINRHVCPKTEYLWEGADGTQLLAFRLGDYARSNYFHLVFRPAVFNRDRSKQVHRWEDGGRVFRLCDGSSVTPFHVLESAGGFYPENVGPAIENLERTDIVGPNTDLALAMQCQDSLEPAAVEGDILRKAREVFGADKVVHASLPAYVEAVRRQLAERGVRLQVLKGEMRHTLKEGVWTDLYPHIHAARPDLRFDGLGVFEDDGEVGDPWVRLAPGRNSVFLTAGSPARITAVERGPVRATIRVERDFPVPGSSDRAGRSATLVPLTLVVDLTLAADARRVDLLVRIRNRARDHRLRLLFPTHLNASVSHAESAYGVVERAIALPDGAGWKEPPSGAHPMFRFVDVSDGRKGFAVIAFGVIQYEVMDRPERVIALTLLRAFQMCNSVRVAEYPDQVDSQLAGEHEFRLASVPHRGGWEEAGLVAEADHFHLPLLSAQMGPGSAECPEMLGTEASFLTVKPAHLVLGAVKKSEEGNDLVVRLANPTARAVAARATFLRPLAGAQLVNLNETDVLGAAAVKGWTAVFPVGPRKIVSLRVRIR